MYASFMHNRVRLGKDTVPMSGTSYEGTQTVDCGSGDMLEPNCVFLMESVFLVSQNPGMDVSSGDTCLLIECVHIPPSLPSIHRCVCHPIGMDLPHRQSLLHRQAFISSRSGACLLTLNCTIEPPALHLQLDKNIVFSFQSFPGFPAGHGHVLESPWRLLYKRTTFTFTLKEDTANTRNSSRRWLWIRQRVGLVVHKTVVFFSNTELDLEPCGMLGKC